MAQSPPSIHVPTRKSHENQSTITAKDLLAPGLVRKIRPAGRPVSCKVDIDLGM